MSDLIYPRLCYPRGGQFSLVDDGFLIDPDSEYSKYYPQEVTSFESIADIPCLVLLGEPGMGKSTALRAEFGRIEIRTSNGPDSAQWFNLRDYSSEDRLERSLFHGEAVQKWKDGDGTLHLFLDSLDEGLLNINSLSAFLISEIEKLPPERTRNARPASSARL